MNFNRRSFIKTGSILGVSTSLGFLQDQVSFVNQNRKAPIVLVHGAWHGGWCWKHVAALLLADGHTVYTPTLTGLGERIHLASPNINLDVHIRM